MAFVVCCHLQCVCSAFSGGSGQQCCYHRNGLLITGPPGGGTVDRVSPDVSVFGHFVQDVLPYLLCCKAGVFSDCGEYYDKRPSDSGVDFSPPPTPRKKWLHLAMFDPLYTVYYYNIMIIPIYSGYVGRSSYFNS